MYGDIYMIITSITPQKSNTGRFNIFIDYTYNFSADYDDIIEFNIKENNAYDESALNDLIYKCQYRKCTNSALKSLTIRVRSEKELREKLKNYNYDGEIINKVVLKLVDLKYIDDTEFSRLWIEQRKKLKLIGKRRLIEELQNKGIEEWIICEVMKEYENDDLEIAVEIINKKLKFIEKQSVDAKAYKKIYAYLIYKGIDYDTAKKALSLCLKSQDI